MGIFSLPPLEYETRAFFIDLGVDVQQAVSPRISAKPSP
jgi:hypothetical protein